MTDRQRKATTKSLDDDKAREKRGHLKPASEKEKLKEPAGEPIPFEGLLGASAMDFPVERYAELLGDPRLSHPVNAAQRARLISDLQRKYGNAYVQRLMDRVQPRPALGESGEAHAPEADPLVATSMDFGPLIEQPHWGSTEWVESPSPFASRALRQRPQPAAPGATPDIQAQDAGAGGVYFHVTAFNAAVAGGLKVTEDAKGVELSSQDYNPTGTVKAVGPKSKVGNWDVGFLQTVYRSDRNFYYASKARTRYSDTLSKLPVRDGDAGKQPWYGMETVRAFTPHTTDTQATDMYDAPSSNSGWDDPVSGEANTLDHTDGKDIFRSWLAVRNRTDFHKLYLRWADWDVDYSTSVNPAKAVGSRVTPVKGAGAKVTGQGKGMGKQPELFDPVANDVQTDVYGKW